MIIKIERKRYREKEGEEVIKKHRCIDRKKERK